jgi:hypothetical protein
MGRLIKSAGEVRAAFGVISALAPTPPTLLIPACITQMARAIWRIAIFNPPD